ncbi:MAG: hypothetical protein RIT45_2025 [Pseudomonadota bacterium]|jgi:hypothetical protein
MPERHHALRFTVGPGALLAGLLGCTTAPPSTPAPPAAAPPAAPPAAPAVTPLALAAIRTRVTEEVTAMQAIGNDARLGGVRLGESNRRLQRAGYFRRIPSHPTPAALRSNLQAAAQQAGVVLSKLEITDDPRGNEPVPGPELRPGERWTPDREALLGRLELELHVRGERGALVDFIEKLPHRVERLVLLRGHRPGSDGTTVLLGEAYFERTLEPPKVQLDWPPLADWLRAAGHDPDAATTRALPGYAELAAAVAAGRELAPDIRAVLLSAADLPRWTARAQLYDRLGQAAAAIRGDALLDSPPQR